MIMRYILTNQRATANIDLEQLGDDGNIIGGLESSAGNLTPLDLDGDSLTLDINQIGGSNTFLGDIWADNFTGYFNFDGSSNDFTIQVDPSNTYVQTAQMSTLTFQEVIMILH